VIWARKENICRLRSKKCIISEVG